MEPANPDDAHRPLEKSHNLAASLSHVETRQVRSDYTLRWDGKLYADRAPGGESAAYAGPTCGWNAAGRFAGGPVWGAVFAGRRMCAAAEGEGRRRREAQGGRHGPADRRGSEWNKNFDLKKGPKVWQAAKRPGYAGEKR